VAANPYAPHNIFAGQPFPIAAMTVLPKTASTKNNGTK
jgi:hypothetical protein